MKKFLSLIASAFMAIALFTGTGGVTPVKAEGNGSITITPPKGAADHQEYKVYKVFNGYGNGDGIRYTLLDEQKKNLDPKTDQNDPWFVAHMGEDFTVDSAGNVSVNDTAKDDNGNLTAQAISDIAAYVGSAHLSPIATVKEKNHDGNYVVTGLDDGYYYITTTTGTVVTINSVNGQQNANVSDKNTNPTIEKKIVSVEDNAGSIDANGKNAIAQVGKNLTYNATITVGQGAEYYVFEDTMPNSLSYVENSVKVYKLTSSQKPSDATLTDRNKVDPSNYQFVETKGNNNTNLTITFGDRYLSGNNKQVNPGDKLVVVYEAKVTDANLYNDKGAKNTATISWGDPNHKSTSLESFTTTYNATITVSKYFQGLKNGEYLSNNDSAEFALKNSDGEYYTLNNNGSVSWGTKNNATKVEIKRSEQSGSFTGLPDGSYTLEEVKVPAGYNKAKDVAFEVEGAAIENFATKTVDYNRTEVLGNNLNQRTGITNVKGSVLPSTGGMGTTLFYIGGIALIVVAAGLLVAKKKRA